MKLKILVLIVMLGVFGGAAQAQHGHSGECNERLYRESLNTVTALADVAKQAVDNGDFDLALELIGQIRRQTATAMAHCMGLVFQSESLGLAPEPIGPVEFPDGAYVVRVITNGALTVTLQAESGDCGGVEQLLTLEAQQAMAPDGVETSFSASTCVATLQVIDAAEPWLIQFEPTGTSGVVSTHTEH